MGITVRVIDARPSCSATGGEGVFEGMTFRWSLFDPLRELHQHTVRSTGMDERLFPEVVREVDSHDFESEALRSGHGLFDVGDLEREVMHTFAAIPEETNEEVLRIGRVSGLDHLESALGQFPLGPPEVPDVVQPTIEERTPHQGGEWDGGPNVVDCNRHVVEPLDAVSEFDVDRVHSGLAFGGSYHGCGRVYASVVRRRRAGE